MLPDELQLKYDTLVSRISVMLHAQQEYFSGKRKGYNEPHKLQKSKQLEHVAKEFVRQLHTERKNPELFGDQTHTTLYKEYSHFLDRSIYLLGLQTKYFTDTSDVALMKKCKAVESELTKLIKAKNEIKANCLF